MNYIDKKILYILQFDTTLGDTLTNVHSDLFLIKKKYPRSVIYTIVHPRTFNTDVCNLLLNKGIVDFVYPLILESVHLEVYQNYINIFNKINFEIILYNRHCTSTCVEYFKSLFSKSFHLQTQHSNFGLRTCHEHFNELLCMDSLKKSYRKNYVYEFVEDLLKLSNGKKTVAIFVGSTRPLANLHNIGLQKIINIVNEIGLFPYLMGSKTFNPYNENGVNWNEIYEIDYKECCNLMGINWIKSIELLKTVNCVISSPTGASMIPPLIGKNMLLINGGDSPIMEGCLNAYTDCKNIEFMKCNCVNYPCGLHNKKNIDIKKYNFCLSENSPTCLNEELNITDIKNYLSKI